MNLNSLMKIGITAIVLLGIFGVPLVSAPGEETGTTPMNATVSVWVDITPSSALAYGVLFGSVDPGTANNRAQNDTTGQSGLTDYNITVDTSSNVVVDLYNNALDTTLTGIAIDNVTIEANQTINGVNINISDSGFTNETNQVNLSTTYYIIGNESITEGPCADVPAGGNCYILYWLDVPSATGSGTKETTYQYCGVAADATASNC